MKVLILVLSLCFLTQIYSQNNSDFFKTIPSEEGIKLSPKWAQAMYSNDPNVPEVTSMYEKYYSENEFVKTIHTQNYKHWIRFTAHHLDKEGFIRPRSAKEETAYLNSISQKNSSNSQRSMSTTWENIGPFETFESGVANRVSVQANVYSISTSIHSNNRVIVGTESGGVFESNDKGSNWQLISKDAAFCNGVNSVAISKADPDTYFAGALNKLYKTTNRGATWTEVADLGGAIHEIITSPSSTSNMWAISSGGLYTSVNSGNTWTLLIAGKFWDLEYHPTNANIVYTIKENVAAKSMDFMKSTNGGATFTTLVPTVGNGWYVPENIAQAKVDGAKIEVSPADPNRVYAALIGDSKTGDIGWIGVYRSNNSGDTWTLPIGQIGSPYGAPNSAIWNVAGTSYHQGFFNFDFEVSPTDANLMWLGTLRLTESTDGAVSFTSIGVQNTTRLQNIHSDVQAIEINGGDIWVVTDGGVSLSTDLLQTHVDKTKGISSSAFWAMDQAWNEDLVVGGRYHNGDAALYANYGVGISQKLNTGGAEEPTGYINRLDNFKGYFGVGGSRLDKSTIPKNIGDATGASPVAQFRPNESFSQWQSSGLFPHPYYAETMLAGKDGDIYRTTDGGKSWVSIKSFGAGKVTEIEYCRKDPSIIYAIYQNGGSVNDQNQLHKSTDGGVTWNQMGAPATSVTDRYMLAVNPDNCEELWVAIGQGFNGQKTYFSNTGGTSFTNSTTPVLDGEKIYDIEYLGGSANNNIVLLTENSFYYRSTAPAWVEYRTGLPINLGVTEKKVVKAFYKDSKLRLGSCRGIWEVDFPPAVPTAHLALPMTASPNVDCGTDLVQFDSHSMVNQAGVTYQWTFAPAPAFISSPFVRNPKVRFGNAGAYNVTLAVTKGGVTSTRVVNNMVTVGACASACSPCHNCSSIFDLNGSAFKAAAGCCYELTPTELFRRGSIWSSDKLDFKESFKLSFNLDLGNISGNDADGMTLVFQKQGYSALSNSGLGYGGINNSIAVAFRTYVFDQINIWINGNSNTNVGGTPHAISGSGSFPVTVIWDEPLQELSVDWGDNGIDMVYANDLVTNIFNGDGSGVIWGFTGFTGGLSANHKVCDINLETNYCVPSYTQAANTKLVGAQNSSEQFDTDGNIESTQNIVANRNVKYDSGSEVNLEGGFEVPANATFEANTDSGCAKGFTCTDAIAIQVGTQTAIGPYQGSGGSKGDATHANWYTFTPEVTASYSISACNQGVDTRLWIYTGSCGNFTDFADSDDDCPNYIGGPDNYGSSIPTLNLLQGVTYYIEWDDAYSFEGFDFQLIQN